MKQARAFPRLPLSSLVALLAVGAWAGVPAVPAGPAAGSGRSAGPAVPYSGRSDDEVLLMGLRLRYQTLSESFPGFPVKDGILIPLGALCHELDLGIRVDPQQATASGFVISEDRPFKLDVGRQRIEVGGKTLIYIPGQVEVHPDDIYVDTRLLAQWLPLDFKVDRLAALLTVTPGSRCPSSRLRNAAGISAAHLPGAKIAEPTAMRMTLTAGSKCQWWMRHSASPTRRMEIPISAPPVPPSRRATSSR